MGSFGRSRSSRLGCSESNSRDLSFDRLRLLSPNQNRMQITEMATRAEEVISRCQRLASFSEDSKGTRRTFLSPAMRECHEEIFRWMEPLGAQMRIDAAGNLRGVYPGLQPDAPRLLIGSHLDTVPNAGAYDGIWNVVFATQAGNCSATNSAPFAVSGRRVSSAGGGKVTGGVSRGGAVPRSYLQSRSYPAT